MSRPVAPNNIARIISMINSGARDAIEATPLPLLEMEGSDSGAQTELDLGLPVPIPYDLVLRGISVAFGGSAGPGTWTATLFHKPSGGSYSAAATATISTP